jgi:MinD-like ATPase involved in chromosome partitioning or flagellar assembly
MTLMSQAPQPPARVVGVAAAKGGIGQSTLAIDWARALGRQDKPSLLLEISGGDLTWLAGANPSGFTEDVASGKMTPPEAAVSIGPNADLLAAGTAWAVYGAPDTDSLDALLRRLRAGHWTDWIVDLGSTRPTAAFPIWNACTTIALVLDDDIACVSRSYAMIRHLTAFGWADRLTLVFNRLENAEQAESLRSRFDQITRQFLGRTWPLCGAVPDAPACRRSAAVETWALNATASEQTQPQKDHRIIKPAVFADNRG